MNDTSRNMMMYDAQKKSVGVAFALWFFLGTLGAHRFYTGRTVTAIAQIVLMLMGAATLWLGVGAFILIGVGIWVLVDAFMLPGVIRRYNVALASRFG
ncbi:TM2 domain-containing protein [Paraburkholderia sp.]|uniref:TM2 domain-containing protein n=1 Tax=Paraburkholderia sp. TaxID=1926495 RepID=UPI0025EC09C0|nr:TM2 domain-containing protein [Paraburkholderia sp.]